MPDIDLEPRKHSHQYELKPISRWWLVVPAFSILLGGVANGVQNPTTWGLLFVGALSMLICLLVFPRYWLSRLE